MWPFKRKSVPVWTPLLSQGIRMKIQEDGTIRTEIKADNFVLPPLTADEIKEVQDPFCEIKAGDPVDMDKAMSDYATWLSDGNTPRETISLPDPFSVAHHVANITAILESIRNRRESLIETGRLEREDFERREAERTEQIAELDKLAAMHTGALKVAHGGSGVDTGGYGKTAVGFNDFVARFAVGHRFHTDDQWYEVTRRGAKGSKRLGDGVWARTCEAPIPSGNVSADPVHVQVAGRGKRATFVIPEGHEAVRDAEGRATGETRPIHVNPSDRDGDKMS